MNVTIENLSVAFAERRVVQDFSLTVPAGRSVAVVGQSGEGKTTLLRVIAGLLPANSGEVRLDGLLPSAQYGSGNLAFLFQEACLCPQLTLRENVQLIFLALRRPCDDAIIDGALAAVGLRDAEGLYPFQSSIGMKARTAIARILCVPPRLLLMDEPFAPLDPVRRAELNRLIRSTSRRMHATTIWVSHDVVEAITYADMIVAMAPSKSIRVFQTESLPEVEDSGALPLTLRQLRDEIVSYIWGAAV